MKYIKTLLVIFTLLFTVSCVKNNYKKNDVVLTDKPITITAVTYPQYPPFTFKEGEELTGFEIELLQNIAKSANINVEFETLEFANIIPAIENAEYDVGVCAFIKTEEREKTLLFGTTYIDTSFVALVSNESWFTDLSELQDKNIGVVSGMLSEDYAKNLTDNVVYVSTDDAFNKLLLDDIDAFICDIATAKRLSNTGDFRYLDEPINDQQIGMIFNLENKNLANVLNQSLSSYMQTQEYYDLLKKYELD